MSKKYYLITYGCQMNRSDSERIITLFKNKGYKMASKINKADLVIINMCSVRQSAVNRVYGQMNNLSKIKKQNQKLKTILTGCILKADKKKFSKNFDFLLDIRELPQWFNYLENKKKQKKIKSYFSILAKQTDEFSAFIPVSNGCNNSCTYCVIPYTRGPLVCRKYKEIIKEVKKAIKKKAKEIWLLGQNVNDYQSPDNPEINFAKLLRMVDQARGNFKFFFTSPHPKNFSQELIKTLSQCQKFGNYFNLPLQSGDDKILKKMNRNYSVKEYKNLVKRIRKNLPQIKLSTDIIVGFPGETKKQFQNTVKLFKQIKFDWAYIAKYSPRPGTAAFNLKDNVSLSEKKEREKILRKIINPIKQNKKSFKKLIVISGPTSSGKSNLAVKLATWLNSKQNKKRLKTKGAEIISADSRQVYKEMNIGTGKITKKEMKNIPHHLLDIASPKRKFSVVRYQKLASETINKIFKKEKIPILCGGTGFYIQAVIDGITIPKIKPDWRLRKELNKMSKERLFQKLKKLDPKRAKSIDKKNKRRLIRALEILIKTKKPVAPLKKKPLPYPILMLGIKKEKRELNRLIKKRLLKRLKRGMVAEIKKLRKSGISWKRLEEFGLEYRFIVQYLQNKINYQEMIDLLQKEIENYAKRQMTWFKKDKRIHWIKDYKEAQKLTDKFL